jgi:hypothetical protein
MSGWDLQKEEADMTDTVQAHCPTCDGERSCDVHGKVYKPWEHYDRSGNSMCGGVQHSLLECRGCQTVFYETESWNDEEIDHWYDINGEEQAEPTKKKETHPSPNVRNKPNWLYAIIKDDYQIYKILSEMYQANSTECYILAAVGLRTALDRATEILGVDPALTFNEKLGALKDGGWIGDTEKDILSVVTDAGNAAAHRGWSPGANEIAELISALEVFLQRAFIVGKKALAIRANIPEKPARKLP